MTDDEHYGEQFFSGHRQGSRTSAEAILNPLLETLAPARIVDLGCGTGTWLSVAKAAGVQTVLGIDGDWVQPDWLEIPREQFHNADLRHPLRVNERFDLALCLEVGEHLPLERAAGLVSDLTALAPVVLFSAAIPGQRGTNHINEQWPDFWAGLFAEHGYVPVDAIRLKYWNDPRVLFWYAQNSLLYVDQAHMPDGFEADEKPPPRLVHPDLYGLYASPRYVGWQNVFRNLSWHIRRESRERWNRLRARRARGA